MIVWGFILQVVMFCYTMAFLIWIHPFLASIMGFFCIVFLSFFTLFGRRMQELSKVRADARSVSHGKIVDSISNIWNIIAFTG
ncbi:MAG TPA: hypothetical protein PK765_04795 [bacterium]|nr:hypothetical protein [bacterium]